MVAPNEIIIATDWLKVTRQMLLQKWVARTGHHSNARNSTWACEIAFGCRTCNEHLSIPCSLLKEANEIGHFLQLSCYDQRCESFVRHYFILLFEFCQELKD